MLGEQPVEQRRVAVLERGQADVAARARRPCAGGARARARPAPRSSGRRSGRRPRSPNASRSSVGKARSLVSSRLPRSAGPASAIVPVGRRRCRRTGRAGACTGQVWFSRHGAPAARFRWPDGIRAAALFSFDLDAEAVMLADHPEVADYLDVIAHQRYGPQVAVPAHSCGCSTESGSGRRSSSRAGSPRPGPTSPARVRDAGHEIGHHGYLHEIRPRRRRGDRGAATC